MQNVFTSLIVPADVTKPVVLYDLNYDDAEEIERIITGHNDAIDFASFGRFGFLVGVDDLGVMKRLPVNTRAINYIRAGTAQQHAYPIYGDALFLGVDEIGEYAHVPDRILVAAGVR